MDWNDLLTRYLSTRGGKPKREALAGEIGRLSVLFTHPHERARLPRGYLDDRPTRAAYAAYFAPANAGKVARVLRELAVADPGLLRRPALRVLDLGCGTGAGGLGLAAALEPGPLDPPRPPRLGPRAADDADPEAPAAPRQPNRDALAGTPRVTYEGLDVSRPALDDAAWFLREAAPGWEVRARTGDLASLPPSGTADLVLLVDALNEAALPQADATAAGADLLRRALAAAAPGGYLVVIEPALRSLTRLLHAVRDRLAASPDAPRVTLPCLHACPCPALAREDAWCHEEQTWERPGVVADIDRRIGHDKRWLKYACLALTREGRTLGEATATGTAPGAAAWRAVSNRHDTNGKSRIAGCGAAGWCDLECLERHETDATRAFFSLERGDVFAVEGPAPEAGARRLKPDDRVTPLTGRGAPPRESPPGPSST
jgi:SAM-dependent methyltransferase